MTDQPTASVDIARYCFGPIVARVEVGETVTWTNRDAALHNVFSAGGDWGWDSSIGPNGGTFSTTFTSPGVYPYVCTIHPTMAGAMAAASVVTRGATNAPANETTAPTRSRIATISRPLIVTCASVYPTPAKIVWSS